MRKLAFLLAAAALLTANAQSTTFEDAKTAVANMGPGWNIGNTLDSHSGDYDGTPRQLSDNHMKIEYGQNGEKWDSTNGVTKATVTDYETAWGQGEITPELIHMFREAGFTTIRIPVTWYPHMGKMNLTLNGSTLVWDKTWKNNDYTINADWMARVKQVVDWVLAEDMYCILNSHHDSGPAPTAWVEANMDRYNATSAAFESMWRQIATKFKDYDERLIFEAYNEIMDTSKSWSFARGSEEERQRAYQAVNAYAAKFVDVVRKSGGNNAQRNLMINTYVAECMKGDYEDCARPLYELSIPSGESNHIIVQVHYYTETRVHGSDWSNLTGDKTYNDCKTHLDQIITRLRTHLPKVTINGQQEYVPVVFGEWGAAEQDNYKHIESVLEEFATYFTSTLKKNGMAGILWRMLADDDNEDTDGNNYEQHSGKGSRDPNNLQWGRPKLKDAIITGYYGAAGYKVLDCYVDMSQLNDISKWQIKHDEENNNWNTNITINNVDNSTANNNNIYNANAISTGSNIITVNCAPGYSFSSVTLTLASDQDVTTVNGNSKTPSWDSQDSKYKAQFNFAAGATSFTLSGGNITAVNFRLTPDLNYYKSSNGKFATALTSNASEVLHENYLYNNGSNWTATQITLYDDIDYTLDKDVTAAAFNYNRTLLDEAHTQGYWQPLCLPVEVPQKEWEKFAKSVIYFSGVDDDELVYTKVTEGALEANKPYIFMPKTSTSANIALALSHVKVNAIPDTEITKTIGKYTIHGNYATKNNMCSTGAYALWDGAFMRAANDDVILKPYRLYLTVNGGSTPGRVGIKVVDPEETGIEGLLEEPVQPTDDIYYDLMGRRVLHPTTGIYIHNGKKVYIR